MSARAGPRSSRPAWRQWALLLVTTVGLAGTLVMGQAVLVRHNLRADLTPERRFTLSEHARKVLSGLNQDVEIVAFLRADDSRNREIADLLNRVGAASQRVRFSLVDMNRNPAVARQYHVSGYGTVVVQSGGRRKDFSGASEGVLIEALLQVTAPPRRRVYFLTGHGEASVTDTSRETGYSGVRTALLTENYEVQTLNLMETITVPADAAVVVIPGSREDLLTGELLALAQFAERGGALFVLVDPQTAPSLVTLLMRYGVHAADDVVVDPENRLFAGDFVTMVVSGLSKVHPVSVALRSPPLFSRVRPVHFGGQHAGIRGIDFLETAPSSWATPDRAVLKTGHATFVPDRDHRGPIPVGVSVLAENPPPASRARIMVVGSADFASNFFLDFLGNKDFFVNCINWLSDQEHLVAARQPGRTPGTQQFFVSAAQGRAAFWLGTVVEPGLFLLAGVVVLLRRRRHG